MARAGDMVRQVNGAMKTSNQSSVDHILSLDTAALLLGHQPHHVSDNGSDVCGEQYGGPHDWPYQYHSWALSPGCDIRPGTMLTVVTRAETRQQVDRLATALHTSYPGAQVIVETPGTVEYTGHHNNVRTVAAGHRILDMVSTKYVLIAQDLDFISNWTNVDRAVSIQCLYKTMVQFVIYR